MSGPSLAQLIKQADHVSLAASQELAETEHVSKQTAANNRAVLRAVIWKYLVTLEPYLIEVGLPREAIEPLNYIINQIDKLETLGERTSLFETSGRAFGMTKPSRRLLAEGHTAGCVDYLHKVIGLGVTDSCKAVASIFSHLGHERRVQERLHSPDGNAALSWTTVHMWHGQLSDPNPSGDASLSDALRRMAMHEAIEGLKRADVVEPIAAMGQDESRMKVAERIALIAAQTRIGASGPPEFTVERLNNSD